MVRREYECIVAPTMVHILPICPSCERNIVYKGKDLPQRLGTRVLGNREQSYACGPGKSSGLTLQAFRWNILVALRHIPNPNQLSTKHPHPHHNTKLRPALQSSQAAIIMSIDRQETVVKPKAPGGAFDDCMTLLLVLGKESSLTEFHEIEEIIGRTTPQYRSSKQSTMVRS